MNQLEKLNPLHKGRIQHPATGYSSTLSQNVEDMHKDFVAFQKTLKNLAMLCTTRHQLMESLNENGLYVSCATLLLQVDVGSLGSAFRSHDC